MGVYQDVPLFTQQHLFTVTLFVMPIEGADVVLGVQWLQTLDQVLYDLNVPQMTFTLNNTTVTSHGEAAVTPSMATFS